MIRLGLIGQKLSHSFSKSFFSKKFEDEGINAAYDLLELEKLENFREISMKYSGLNVTIPYKSQIIPLLDNLDPAAKEVGAVNTIKIEGIELTGYNTDVIGFEYSLLHFIDTSKVKKALILGTGGASKAVAFVLSKLNIDHLFISRKTGGQNVITYSEIEQGLLNTCQLIVNATPLGMYPNTEQAPALPIDYLNGQWVYDLIYNPLETKFLKEASQRNCKIKNGPVSYTHL